jgi:hypothetical protein
MLAAPNVNLTLQFVTPLQQCPIDGCQLVHKLRKSAPEHLGGHSSAGQCTAIDEGVHCLVNFEAIAIDAVCHV